MNDTSNQTPSSSIDTLPQEIVDAVLKSGGYACLGIPPEEDLERFRDERTQREIALIQRQDAARLKELVELKKSALNKIKRGELL